MPPGVTGYGNLSALPVQLRRHDFMNNTIIRKQLIVKRNFIHRHEESMIYRPASMFYEIDRGRGFVKNR